MKMAATSILRRFREWRRAALESTRPTAAFIVIRNRFALITAATISIANGARAAARRAITFLNRSFSSGKCEPVLISRTWATVRRRKEKEPPPRHQRQGRTPHRRPQRRLQGSRLHRRRMLLLLVRPPAPPLRRQHCP